MNSFLLRAASACAVLLPQLAAQGGSATYELTFATTWSRATHPKDFPSNPHFSPLIGGTHNGKARFWMPGGIATQGIENMAEFGGTTQLSNEVNVEIRKGNADQVIFRGGLANSPGSRTIRFTIKKEFSKLTLVSMLAPSPDWYVGTDSLELLRNGQWVDNLVVPLHVWDAGTDLGTTYLSPNRDATPHLPIARVTTKSGPFENKPGPIGTFTIKRVSSSLVYGCGVNPRGSMTVDGDGTIGRTTTLRYSDPTRTIKLNGPTAIAFSAKPDPAFPCGTRVPGLGLAANSAGELLLGLPIAVFPGAAWQGTALAAPLAVPSDAGLVGVKLYFQALLADATRVGVTDAAELVLGR